MTDLLTLPNAAALLLGASLVLYAVFAGADFGAGIWILLGRFRQEDPHRLPMLQAMGPVWETNHIWLIVAVVTLFTAFPTAFGALFTALLAPLVVTLLGITFRGASFAYWHYGESGGTRAPEAGPEDADEAQQARRASGPGRVPGTVEVLSIASLLTPFAMGMAVAAVAGGGITIEEGTVTSGPWESWISWFTLGGGIVAIAICAYLTPTYMAVRTAGALREGYRRRGMAGALFLGAATTAMLPVSWKAAPDFFDRLTEPAALAVVAAAVLLGMTALGDLYIGQLRAAQLTAGLTVAATIGGLLVALHPDVILNELTIAEAAAPRVTLIAYLAALGAGALLLVPALVLLYYTYRGEPDPEQSPRGAPETPSA